MKSYSELGADMALERETNVDEIFGDMRRCTKCILPETFLGITFDSTGSMCDFEG